MKFVGGGAEMGMQTGCVDRRGLHIVQIRVTLLFIVMCEVIGKNEVTKKQKCENVTSL